MWRGLACVGMFIYHMEAIRMFVFSDTSLWLNDLTGLMLGYFVRFSFLLLVGISTYIVYTKSSSYKSFAAKQSRRALIVTIGAALVSLASWVVMPDYLIVFGILHLIACSICLMILFAGLGRLFNLIAGVVLLAIWVGGISGSLPGFFGVVVGWPEVGFTSFDYFPVIPWLGVVMLGFASAFPLLRLSEKFLQFGCAPLNYIGKRALIFYIIHLPFIYCLWRLIYFL